MLKDLESKLAFLIFLAVLALSALFGAAMLMPEPAHGHGALHPEVPHMLIGGSGGERHGPILWLGWGVGVCEFLLFAGLMTLGARQRDGLRGLGGPLLVSLAACLAAWTWLLLAYRDSMDTPDAPLYLALPAPTAITLYLLWPVPILFIACFVLGFRRWVLTEEDQAAFEELMAERRSRRDESS